MPMRRLHSLSLRDLHTLLVLDTAHSLGRAAIALNVSAATLSRRLTRVEDALGITLFERSVTGIRPTHPGLQVLRHTRRIIGEARYLLNIIAGETDLPDGEIRIGVAHPPLHPVLEIWFRIWNDYYSRTPIRLYVPEGESIVASLGKGHVDAAIIPDCALTDRVASLVLYHDKLLATLPKGHPLSNFLTLPITNILQEKIFVPVDPYEEYRWYSRIEPLNHHNNIIIHTGGIVTLLSQVRAGSGIGLTNTACRDLSPLGLVFRPIAGLNDSFDIHLAWRLEAEDALLGRFVSLMRSLAQARLSSLASLSAISGTPGPLA